VPGMYSLKVEASCSSTTSAPELAISRAWPQVFPWPKWMFHVMTRSRPPVLLVAAALPLLAVVLLLALVLVLVAPDVDPDDEATRGMPPGGVMPGGYQPPPAQTQSGPGFTVVHPIDGTDGAEAARDAPPGRGMPGGYQPPPAQTQPGPGFTVGHPADGAGVADDSPPGRGMPGGYQPPPTQTQSGPGFTVVHSPDCAAASRVLCRCATRLTTAKALTTSVVPTRIFFNFKRISLMCVGCVLGEVRERTAGQGVSGRERPNASKPDAGRTNSRRQASAGA